MVLSCMKRIALRLGLLLLALPLILLRYMDRTAQRKQ